MWPWSSLSYNLFLLWLLCTMLSESCLVHLIMVITRDISQQELKQYDGSDSNKPFLMAQIYDVSLSRCPRLKRLVMPAWNRIKEAGICRAIRMWEDLESLTMPSIEDPACVMGEIGRSCKHFAELKIMGPCDTLFASTLVEFLPNLKVLSVRCTVLPKPALVIILDGFKKLEVLNISHCLITEGSPPAPEKILTKLDESILEKACRLRKFLTCMSDSCIMCQRIRNDEGLIRWYKYEEDLWKVDEVRSLSV
ncbi:F-box/LRR-repeat protein At3g48880-like isoform X2 [Lycium barbarum]|uniref:F-box/LRR-repeat protein At3g48880-like isoform X2 n=1 Tax=Lycium barbarum TaxID=112863 RepID=UPI00293EEB1C|nr:F-box/LRR-repeat protein At3g48880-like isoform X2 [Lycium barbarum]